jgi:hypothetical protein
MIKSGPKMVKIAPKWSKIAQMAAIWCQSVSKSGRFTVAFFCLSISMDIGAFDTLRRCDDHI